MHAVVSLPTPQSQESPEGEHDAQLISLDAFGRISKGGIDGGLLSLLEGDASWIQKADHYYDSEHREACDQHNR